jgi:hypothetical protein
LQNVKLRKDGAKMHKTGGNRAQFAPIMCKQANTGRAGLHRFAMHARRAQTKKKRADRSARFTYVTATSDYQNL